MSSPLNAYYSDSLFIDRFNNWSPGTIYSDDPVYDEIAILTGTNGQRAGISAMDTVAIVSMLLGKFTTEELGQIETMVGDEIAAREGKGDSTSVEDLAYKVGRQLNSNKP